MLNCCSRSVVHSSSQVALSCFRCLERPGFSSLLCRYDECGRVVESISHALGFAFSLNVVETMSQLQDALCQIGEYMLSFPVIIQRQLPCQAENGFFNLLVMNTCNNNARSVIVWLLQRMLHPVYFYIVNQVQVHLIDAFRNDRKHLAKCLSLGSIRVHDVMGARCASINPTAELMSCRSFFCKICKNVNFFIVPAREFERASQGKNMNSADGLSVFLSTAPVCVNCFLSFS